MRCSPINAGHVCVPDVLDATVTGASGRVYRFEFDRWGGPMLLRKDGEPMKRQPGEGHEFWKAFWPWFSAWVKEHCS